MKEKRDIKDNRELKRNTLITCTYIHKNSFFSFSLLAPFPCSALSVIGYFILYFLISYTCTYVSVCLCVCVYVCVLFRFTLLLGSSLFVQWMHYMCVAYSLPLVLSLSLSLSLVLFLRSFSLWVMLSSIDGATKEQAAPDWLTEKQGHTLLFTLFFRLLDVTLELNHQ